MREAGEPREAGTFRKSVGDIVMCWRDVRTE